jgi:alkylhydroperoxidase/carboxymuconolactone decarboxylase family protein
VNNVRVAAKPGVACAKKRATEAEAASSAQASPTEITWPGKPREAMKQVPVFAVPALMANDLSMKSGLRRLPMETYYKPEDLPKFPDIGKAAPELAQKFFDYYNAVFAEGVLTEREKALIALAVAHAVQCPYCIDAFTQACLEKGSNITEMTEAVHVVTAIRGGASLVHGVQMRNIAQKLSM